MNLTDDQEDLLRTLVAVYQGGQTSQFVLNISHGGSTLIYPSGPPVSFPFDDMDLHQLAQERLIALSRNSAGELCGKLTKLGIETVVTDFATSSREAESQIRPLIHLVVGIDSPTEATTHPQVSMTTLFPTIHPSGATDGPQEETGADVGPGNRKDRRSMVDAFVLRCHQETHVKVIEKYIWLAAGHNQARQFQYWKAGDSKATEADSQNFERILGMNPLDFIELLKKKGIES